MLVAKNQIYIITSVVLVSMFYMLIQASDNSTSIIFQRIGTNSERLVDIYSMDIDGDNLTRLTSIGRAYQPAVSPDGSVVAFTAEGSEDNEASAIYLLHLQQSEVTEIVSIDDLAEFDLDLVGLSQSNWSHDGQYIVFVATYSSESCEQIRSSDLFWVEIEGRSIGRLTNDCSQESDPDWSPNGDRILYLSNQDFYDEYALYVVDRDGYNQMRIPLDIPSNPVSPQWYMEGDEIVLAANFMGWAFLTVNIHTFETSVLSDLPIRLERVSSFDLAADTQKLVFAGCDGNQCLEDIFVFDISTGEVVQVTRDGTADVFPSWLEVEVD